MGVSFESEVKSRSSIGFGFYLPAAVVKISSSFDVSRPGKSNLKLFMVAFLAFYSYGCFTSGLV